MASVIGFDFGERRIGIAVGQLDIGLANPLTTLLVSNSELPWEEIGKIIQEWKPKTLVVGYVDHPTQDQNSLKIKITGFCKNLKSRYHLPVEMVEESYTSKEAYSVLKDMRSKGQRKKINKTDIDKAAAAIILDTWLNNNAEKGFS